MSQAERVVGSFNSYPCQLQSPYPWFRSSPRRVREPLYEVFIAFFPCSVCRTATVISTKLFWGLLCLVFELLKWVADKDDHPGTRALLGCGTGHKAASWGSFFFRW